MTDLRLMHYTLEPITFDRDRDYQQRGPTVFGKPNGLWVSATGDDDWPTYVRHNINDDRLRYAHAVELIPHARVHRIDNAYELDAFTEKYAVQTEYERRGLWRCDDRAKWPIDWHWVARDFDGVIIAPYQWSCRMSHDWYYGWDCASGCIWNLDAVASVELIRAEAAAS